MHRASPMMISFGLVVATCGSALGQQRISPVTINPGAGSAPGVTVNLTPPYVYGTPNIYGGFPGVYGGAVVVSPGGWNYPGGGYYGNPGYGPGSLDVLSQQALASSRYELQTAQASEAYAKANFFQQQAIGESIRNAQAMQPPPIRERYNAKTARPKGSVHAPKGEPTLALDQLMTRDGGILWPSAAPANTARGDFDAAIANLAKAFQTEGKADVDDINAARNLLQAYGVPALAKVRREKPTQAPAMKTFLNSLDATLAGWAK